MMIKKILNIAILIFIVLFSIIACTRNGQEPSQQEDPEKPPEEEIEEEEEIDLIAERLKEMTLEEKIGQMFVVGFDGDTINEQATQMIEEYKVSGFILFKKNIVDSSQLLNLTNSLKIRNQINETPIFISVDEEGGRVTRLPDEIQKLPTAKSIGEINDESFTYELGKALGQSVKGFGFNMNYAPVLDINSNPNNPVIGDRSFGDKDDIVARLGISIMQGLQDTGVVPVVKHFPGHGDTSEDSHIGLPSIGKELQELKSFELVPFREAIENRADAVMVAHILFSKLDTEYPSSMSKAIMKDLLRDELKFEGVIITDDMTMGAITENYNIGNAVVKSVDAGADIILVCHGYENQIESINAIKTAIEEGTITEERIDESVYKILELKGKYNLKDEPIDNVDMNVINENIKALLDTYNLSY